MISGLIDERVERLTRIRLQRAIYFCLYRGSLPENTAGWQVCLNKNAFRRRLEGVERENLNPPSGLRASHEWMGDVSTIPEAGGQNPGSHFLLARTFSELFEIVQL